MPSSSAIRISTEPGVPAATDDGSAPSATVKVSSSSSGSWFVAMVPVPLVAPAAITMLASVPWSAGSAVPSVIVRRDRHRARQRLGQPRGHGHARSFGHRVRGGGQGDGRQRSRRLPRDGDGVVPRRRVLGRHPHRDRVGSHVERDRAARRAARHRVALHRDRRRAVVHRRRELHVRPRVRNSRGVARRARREGPDVQRRVRAPGTRGAARRQAAQRRVGGRRRRPRDGHRVVLGRRVLGRHPYRRSRWPPRPARIASLAEPLSTALPSTVTVALPVSATVGVSFRCVRAFATDAV